MNGQSETPRTHRSVRYGVRFRLRSLLLALVALSILLGWVAVPWYKQYRADRALGAIRSVGGRAVADRDGVVPESTWPVPNLMMSAWRRSYATCIFCRVCVSWIL